MWISEVAFQDPRTKTYLGSPTIVRHEDALIAAHDYFGPGCPHNHEGEEHLTSIHRSSDDGLTWRRLTHVAGAFWSSLFVHRGDLYLIGASAQYGSIVIRRSTDSGFTWSHPANDKAGLLFPGGPLHQPPNYHCAPMPVLSKGGRLYRAFEDNDPLHWPKGFQATVISISEDDDLLDGANWRMSNKLAYDPDTSPADFGGSHGAGWLEGNVVEGPDGQLWNILRVNSEPVLNKAAMVRIVDEGARLEFDADNGFIDLPGGLSKFTIRRDPADGVYWTLSNPMCDGPWPIRRNCLALFSSPDLTSWTQRRVLLSDNMESTPDASCRLTGFQYVDWQFDGDDLIYLVRTAYDGAHNFHDANRITFSKVRNYRSLLDIEA